MKKPKEKSKSGIDTCPSNFRVFAKGIGKVICKELIIKPAIAAIIIGIFSNCRGLVL